MVILSFGLCFLVGCSDDLAKVHIQSVGKYEKRFDHEGCPIELWTDLDIEFVEPCEVGYRILFYQDGALVEEITCNPLSADEKQMHRIVERNGLVKISYLGQMKCDVSFPQGGRPAMLYFTVQAERFKVFRAGLIFK